MKHFFFIVIFFIPLVVNSQNYKEGYILSNNGDTIKGIIDYKADKTNAKVCYFKTKPGAETQSFHPEEIAGYRIWNEKDKETYYTSKEINIDGNSQLVFVEYLLQGVMNLYFYPSEKQNYYILEEDGVATYVTKQADVLDKKDGKEFYRKDVKYRGILAYLFKDTPAVAEMAGKIDFNHKSMINLVKKYHDTTCATGEACVVFLGDGNKRKAKFKFSLYAGANYLLSSEIFIWYNSDMNFDMTKVNPLVGGQVVLYAPRISQSVGVVLDASFSKLKGSFDGYARYHSVANGYRDYNYRLELDEFSFSGKLGFRYTFQTGKIKPTLEGGYSYSTLLGNKLKETDLDDPSKSEDSRLELVRKYHGPYISAGVDFKLKKDNYIFCRISYEKNSSHADGSHGIELLGIKTGYTF
ncbi:hypothetical protein [Dysgonomonas sp. 511]|uniref:hypothetical protein n=1 Tax=Dysgonomonas sp. 511 TaxID=2302930 RepID=UPI0013D0E778|nr:hypothetical protein [Dysgonomonas sp. 511]NDV77531.1 hypothetical protein [Dysgonomonas sp. 511]